MLTATPENSAPMVRRNAKQPPQHAVMSPTHVVAVIAGQVVQVPRNQLYVSADGALTIPYERSA